MSLAEHLERANKRGVSIEIIGGPMIDKGSSVGELARKGILTYYQLPYRPTTHFTVVDDTYVRFELPHPPGSYERKGWFGRDKRMASKLAQHFDELKRNSERYLK